MNIHEYQAKGILRKYGIEVPSGVEVLSESDIGGALSRLGSGVKVVKSQIHAGGRGAGRFKGEEGSDKGGVRLCRNEREVREAVSGMLGKVLVTKQTGEEGKEVKRLYIEEGSIIERELYFSMTVDRGAGAVRVIASGEGGMDIEEVAEKKPSAIASFIIQRSSGCSGYHGRKLAFALGLSGETAKQAVTFLSNCYKAFVEIDALMLEVNPLIIDDTGKLVALDAKMSFDENALFRQGEIASLRDRDEESEVELEAGEHGLSYIKLDGSIGCLVNGAGLAMATMDIIKLKGGEPANFLDVGGGAPKERVAKAFKIILSDKKVGGILVNIFGGIMRCDIIAEGIMAAAKDVGIDVPLVVRLEGTNVEKGRELLSNSGLSIIAADSLDDAAGKIVKAVNNKV